MIETKLKQGETFSLDGYVWHGMNRRNQLITARCGIFIKNELLSKWNFVELDKEMDGLYFVRITNCDNDISIILSVCYLPPENSSWALDCDAFFSHFTAFLYSMAD